MLAKLSSYTLVGIDALPVEVEVDVSPASMPKTVLVGTGRDGGQGEHAPGRAGDGQLGISPRLRPGRDQPRAGRPQEGCRRLRPADRAGAAGRQRAVGLRAAGAIRRGRRARPDGRDAADQGGAGDGAGGRRRGARRHPRPRGQRRGGGGRREARGLPHRQPLRGGRVPLGRARHRPQGGRSRRGLPPLHALRGRLRRREGAGLRQAGPADRRRGEPQRPDDRPARYRQDAAGAAAADDHAAADAGREPGDDADLQRDGAAAGRASR